MGDFGLARANLSFDDARAALLAGAKVRRPLWSKHIVLAGGAIVWDYTDDEWASLGFGTDKSYFPNPIDTEACDWIAASAAQVAA